MPKNAVVVEVGTQTGNFAEKILEITQVKELHLIDISYRIFNYAALNSYINEGRIILHEGDSSTILKTFEDKYFDWIYVDGDHEYEGVVKDIDAAFPKVKKDGFIVFNDYTSWSPLECMPYGVYPAVNEFILKYNFKLDYFAFHNEGYHDIAVKVT